MEGKSAPPVMIPMSRSSRDYRASKNPKVSSEDTSSVSAASKKSQIRASGSPTRSAPATKKAKTGGSTLVEQNHAAHAVEISSSRSDSANQPLRPASRSKRAADVNGDVTLDTLRPTKKSKISYSLKYGEASAEDKDSLISKNVKAESVRNKQTSGTAAPSKTSEATLSDNALNALKLPKSRAGSAGGSSHTEETNIVGGSVSQISEGAVNAAGSSEPPELAEQRSLRPRPKPPVSKKVVKRTRFQEVSLDESDGPRIVGRRIKVFWPLDKKWYYGSVKAYNGAKKQHKIIYDDHDEEWLKLQKESFRLEVKSGDSFGLAAPSSDLADLADLVAIVECVESSKHRGDVDGSTSASDDKPSAERTGVRRSKAGRDSERKRKGEGIGEEKKKLDGTSEHRKTAGRGIDKKLEGDSEPKKKGEGGGDRGKKSEAAKSVGRKRGDARQRGTKGEKLGRGNAKRAVLEVYERRKKRAQGVVTSVHADRKGKGIASDGLSERRKRNGKESSRKTSISQTRTRHSASEATESKKTSRRGIRDNDRLFASIKSPSAVLRRKVAENKRSKESKSVESTPARVHISREDEVKVFSPPQGEDAGSLQGHEMKRGKVAVASTIGPVPPGRINFEQECDTVGSQGGSPVTSTADVTEEDDTACEEADSSTPVLDIAADDKATSDGCRDGCRDDIPSCSESMPSELRLVRDDGTRAFCGDQIVVRHRGTDTSELDHSGGEFLSVAECVDESTEGVQQIENVIGGPTLQAVQSKFEFFEESSNQEVLRSAFHPVTIPTSEMKHSADKVYVRVRHKLHKVYRRETHQSSQVQTKGIQDEGPRACAPVAEPVFQQLSASSCVISALHVFLDGPWYFGVGLEGPRYLSSLRISGLGRWSMLRDGTLQLGTYFGVPGVLSLLRVSQRFLHLFLTAITKSKTVVGLSLVAVGHNADSSRSGACLGGVFEHNFTPDVSTEFSSTRPGVLLPRTGHSRPLRRRRIIVSFHPYLNDPLRDFKRFSVGRQFAKEPSGIDRNLQRLFAQGSRIPLLTFEHALAQMVVSVTTSVQELPFSFCGESGHLPSRDGPSRSSGEEVVPLSQRWIISHSHFKQISSASSFFNMRRDSLPNALLYAALEAARRECWMVKFSVGSVSGESAWHNPQGWSSREVGTYYGRRSLLSLLRVSVNDLSVGCSFSSSSPDDGWQLAIILMVVRDVYGFCKACGFGISHVSGRDCKELVRGLIRKLLADRAVAFHLARVWGLKVVTGLREIADYYDGFPRRREIREIAYELTHLCDSRSSHPISEDWGSGSRSEVVSGLVNVEICSGGWDRGDQRENGEYTISPRRRQICLLKDCYPRIRSNGEVAPTTGLKNMHPIDASCSCDWIPRLLLSPEEMSMCASALARAVRRPRLPLASPSIPRFLFRNASALEGTALPVGRVSTIQRIPSVFVVLGKASYAAAGPGLLLFASGSRKLQEGYPRNSMSRCSDVGTYFGPPSIDSFLRISKDFWRRIFQRPGNLEEASNICAFNSVPIVDEEPVTGLFSHWPELSSVDTVDTEDLSDLEDRLQVMSAERSKVGESSEGKESNENSTGDDFESMKPSSELLPACVKGRRTGKGLKRGFVSVSADGADMNGAEAECHSGGETISERPYSKRTRTEIESIGAEGITENGVEPSSPSSDVDGNECPVPPAAEQKSDESALPRVNVLKLRRCPTNKGLWRVAGNSCASPIDTIVSGRALDVRDSGEGAELMTPVFDGSRKRGFNHFSESPLVGRNDQSGTSVLTSMFSSNLTDCSPSSFDQDMLGATANKAFSLDSKPKEVWYDCGMTYINDVSDGLEPRKRRRKGPSPPAHSDDVEAVSEHSLRRSTDSGWVPCMANVLITRSDRCFREAGAVVELQPGHGNTWMLSVTLSGESKFAYKADQPVATGTSNKFTHAMMWRGGKDWSLEFVDRKQWQLFKDLHEECFQRTVRAATVRHIPIPGVKQIPDIPRTGMRFVRPYAKYIHQTDGEVEAALTSSRVIYDMDSEDEEWLNQVNAEKVTSRGTRSRPRIEEDTLERVIDKLEKISFVRPQQEPLPTSQEAVEVCQMLASLEAIRAIHGYWYDKRNRKGMALVRHFQPASWEQYQRLLEDWQSKVNQLQQQSPTASKQQLQSICKRPPLFAFCLRPRGLENRNKMQKQRSQRKQGLGGSSSRQWTLAGPASDFFLDSPSKRPGYLESSSGSFYGTGSRKYPRQRMMEESQNHAEPIPVDLTDSFNALASGEGFTSSGGAEQVIAIRAGGTFSQVDSSPPTRTERVPTARPHKKKVGRKARKMRLLASAEESRRKRQLRVQQGHVKERFLDMVHSPHAVSQFGQPIDTPSTSILSFPQTDSEDVDLEAIALAKAAAAKLARETATAKRARAQALYAVADAAMHKAVAAVIAADAIHASERAMEKAAAMLGHEVESPEQTGEVPVKDEGSRTRLRTPVTEGGTSFGSWRRALNSASRNANHLLSKGTNSKQGLMPDTDDPLLPVASWSQELGAGLGTRLLQTGEVSPQRQRYSPVLDGLSKSPTRGVGSLGRTRGESMMAMLTR